MARVQTIVQLNTELIARLDDVAGKHGLSRSGAIRQAIQDWLQHDEDAQIGRLIADGYRRMPPPTVDEWGNLDEQSDANTSAALRALDDEEEQAGIPPW